MVCFSFSVSKACDHDLRTVRHVQAQPAEHHTLFPIPSLPDLSSLAAGGVCCDIPIRIVVFSVQVPDLAGNVV